MSTTDAQTAVTFDGWHLRPEFVTQHGSPAKAARAALDQDLADVGVPVLPKSLASEDVKLEGPLVLQVVRVVNVSASPSFPGHYDEDLDDGDDDDDDGDDEVADGAGGLTASQFAAAMASSGGRGAPPLMRVTLTDGRTKQTAVDLGGVRGQLRLKTPPGTKIRLGGPSVAIRKGYILLGPGDSVLGGRVEKLLSKWNVQMALQDMDRRLTGGADGPPPFIPFDVAKGSRPEANARAQSAAGSQTARVTRKGSEKDDSQDEEEQVRSKMKSEVTSSMFHDRSAAAPAADTRQQEAAAEIKDHQQQRREQAMQRRQKRRGRRHDHEDDDSHLQTLRILDDDIAKLQEILDVPAYKARSALERTRTFEEALEQLTAPPKANSAREQERGSSGHLAASAQGRHAGGGLDTGTVDQQQVHDLVQMGFGRDQAVAALLQTHSVDAAVALLVENDTESSNPTSGDKQGEARNRNRGAVDSAARSKEANASRHQRQKEKSSRQQEAQRGGKRLSESSSRKFKGSNLVEDGRGKQEERTWSPGDECVARFNVDNELYPAVVKLVFAPQKQAKVAFVGYEDDEWQWCPFSELLSPNTHAATSGNQRADSDRSRGGVPPHARPQAKTQNSKEPSSQSGQPARSRQHEKQEQKLAKMPQQRQEKMPQQRQEKVPQQRQEKMPQQRQEQRRQRQAQERPRRGQKPQQQSGSVDSPGRAKHLSDKAKRPQEGASSPHRPTSSSSPTQKHSSISRNTTKEQHSWKVGDACFAVYAEDGYRYAARIHSIHGGDKVVVAFVDYDDELQPTSIDQVFPTNVSKILEHKPSNQGRGRRNQSDARQSTNERHEASSNVTSDQMQKTAQAGDGSQPTSHRPRREWHGPSPKSRLFTPASVVPDNMRASRRLKDPK